MNRTLATLLAAVVPTLVLVVLAATARVPLVAMGPGPTFDTLGTVTVLRDGHEQQVPVVEVTGRTPDRTSGVLDMTTVAVRDKLTLGDAVRYWIDRDQTVVPRDQVFPPDRSEDEVDAKNEADMTGSEDSAEVAAYRHLRLPLHAELREVTPGGAADGELHPGDVVTAVDGTATPDSRAVVAATAAKKAGDTVRVDYVRDGRKASADVRLRANPEARDKDAERGYLGVTVGDSPADGTDVHINIGSDVGGPSAGLVFALAIVDKLSPGELVHGGDYAGTGTIDADGKVGPIGGIRHKIVAARASGATEFLVPDANCSEAAQDPPEGIRLLRVHTLDEAIGSLQQVSGGGAPPTCG